MDQKSELLITLWRGPRKQRHKEAEMGWWSGKRSAMEGWIVIYDKLHRLLSLLSVFLSPFSDDHLLCRLTQSNNVYRRNLAALINNDRDARDRRRSNAEYCCGHCLSHRSMNWNFVLIFSEAVINSAQGDGGLVKRHQWPDNWGPQRAGQTKRQSEKERSANESQQKTIAASISWQINQN